MYTHTYIYLSLILGRSKGDGDIWIHTSNSFYLFQFTFTRIINILYIYIYIHWYVVEVVVMVTYGSIHPTCLNLLSQESQCFLFFKNFQFKEFYFKLFLKKRWVNLFHYVFRPNHVIESEFIFRWDVEVNFYLNVSLYWDYFIPRQLYLEFVRI